MITVRSILARFGPLPAVRKALSEIPGVRAPTIQALSSWQVNDRIPSRWQRPLMAAARAKGIEISAADIVGEHGRAA